MLRFFLFAGVTAGFQKAALDMMQKMDATLGQAALYASAADPAVGSGFW